MNVDEGWYVKLGGRALDEGGEAGFGVLHNVRCTCSLHSINDRIALQIKVFFSESSEFRNHISADFFRHRTGSCRHCLQASGAQYLY